MRRSTIGIPLLLAALAAACQSDGSGVIVDPDGTSPIRVVNAFPSAVDVLIDGTVAIQALQPGQIDTGFTTAGAHTVVLRQTGSAVTAQASLSTNEEFSTIAAVRLSNGSIASAVLDDTNSVVPAGATKVRVLHLAPNAGEIQVYRTQPDWQTPVRWQFPFTYQAEPTSADAPFYQSTVGTWEVRAWQTPTDESGWSTAPVKVTIPLGSGEKRTVVILDKPGGGIRAETF